MKAFFFIAIINDMYLIAIVVILVAVLIWRMGTMSTKQWARGIVKANRKAGVRAALASEGAQDAEVAIVRAIISRPGCDKKTAKEIISDAKKLR